MLEQCKNTFNHPPRFLGMGYMRLLAAFLFLSLAASTLFFVFLQRKLAAASSRKGSSSAIFPAFENFLYLLIVVNIYTGVLILSTDYEVGGKITYVNFLFAVAISFQHVISEGIAFMLMQRGCGYYAIKRTACYAFAWGVATYLFLTYTFYQKKGSFEVFVVWNTILLVFYVCLWFLPLDYLFRRPAAMQFAKIFTVYHGVMLVSMIFEYYFTSVHIPCMFFYNFLFIEPFLQPIFAYYILLEDSRWWQGLGRFAQLSTTSRNKESQVATSPLHQFDISIKSAQTLAKVLDHMGGAATATLISFSHIRYDKRNVIGFGSFSKVYRGKFKEKDCAVKLVFTMDLTEEDICRVAAEATILSSITSVNVVKIFGVTVLPPSVCIVLELCAYGSLSDVLRLPKALSLSFEDRLFLCLGCARGVAALHAINESVVHRDIKSFNFLVDYQLNAKLADLELGVDTDEKHDIKNIDDNSLFESDFLANWMAPEVLRGLPYTQASDIYSMSLVFWEIFTSDIPFSEKHNNSIRQAIIENQRPDVNHPGFLTCPPVLRNIIIAGWSADPDVRPVACDFVSITESVWLSQIVNGLSMIVDESELILKEVSDYFSDESSLIRSSVKLDKTEPKCDGNERIFSSPKLQSVHDVVESNAYWKVIRNLDVCCAIVSNFFPHMILHCSNLWEELTGYSQENLFGYTLNDLLCGDHPDSDEALQCFCKDLQLHKSGHCVIRIKTSSGKNVDVSLHAVPFYQKALPSIGENQMLSSGAVQYGRNVAFFSFTASILTHLENFDSARSVDESIASKLGSIFQKYTFSTDRNRTMSASGSYCKNSGNGPSYFSRSFANRSSRESRASCNDSAHRMGYSFDSTSASLQLSEV